MVHEAQWLRLIASRNYLIDRRAYLANFGSTGMLAVDA
eukprot:CAMPEP_0177196442 /NCGR_PEP_ID=MMETSP0367-20130122/24047_1 /TAXON_ID=447022 ORGANISM="Scrippsiella hangoei-like, Strain SHHI-4" /NCGR_SAMPLE_ID=MMETSP0367 /ASSEMBLY_ACC=CAM_ASM_000362 /LENGTH=37 /DNA_ID= /DNA_START= /DNA_END= /DNA_ORIENTATION=